MIDIKTVSAIEVEMTKDAPAFILFAGTVFICDGIKNTDDDLFTVGYLPYKGYKNTSALPLSVQMIPCRLFADAPATLTFDSIKDENFGTVEYVNGSDADEKVCIWNSPRLAA